MLLFHLFTWFVMLYCGYANKLAYLYLLMSSLFDLTSVTLEI